MLDRVRELADEFDILHFHIDQFHFPLFRPIANRTVTTLHGRQDLHDLKPLYVGFSDMPLVSISKAQRRPVANANFVATVHHGIPDESAQAQRTSRAAAIVAFLGRISPEKRPDRAIRIARALGNSAQDRRQGRQGRRGLFSRDDRAAARSAGRRIYRRDQRARKERIPRRGAGAAVPDRLAGAVRAVHDRSDGLRHAGARLPLRLGAGDHRPRRHRSDRRHDGRGGENAAAGAGARSARGPAAIRGAVFRHAHGQGLSSGLPCAAQASIAIGARGWPPRRRCSRSWRKE